MDKNIDVNEFTVEELEALFNDDVQPDAPPASNETTPPTDDVNASNTSTENESNSVEQSKAFAKRLKESTDKVRKEEREAIAKSLGYESYDDLQKNRDKKYLEEKGLDPDQVSEAVEELVNKRIAEDPRMLELDEFKKQRIKEFADKELAEISKLTGGEITKLNQLPKAVIDLWATKGSLKAAYMELEGEKLINKIRGEQSKGTTNHLANPSGGGGPGATKRYLTDEEKRVWKIMNPSMTAEELNKQMVDK